MVQFVIGFWSGFAAAALVLCLLQTNKRKNSADSMESDRKETEVSTDATEKVSSDFRILLVDDSKLSRTVIKGYLANGGFEIIEAESGSESLGLVKKYSFDLIFLDQHMPGLDGDEILYLLRQTGLVDRNVPVVALSSTLRNENESGILDRGYVACLGKPIQKNRLEEVVADALEAKRCRGVPKGFSYRKGLEHFDGNEAVYRETLVLFAELWTERKEQLRRFLEEENMPEYAILIHAIKGDARTLGAEELGELAYQQELQAKAGNAEAIRNGFDRVMEMGDETAEYFLKSFSEQVTGGE